MNINEMIAQLKKQVNNYVLDNYQVHLERERENIISYLLSNKKSIVVEKEQIDDYIKYKKNPNLLEQEKFIKVEDNKITTYVFDEDTANLIGKYISRDVEELTIPFSFFNKVSIKEFKKLKKLNIVGDNITLTEEVLDNIFDGNNIEEVKGWFTFDISQLKNSIVLENNLISYKGRIVRNNYTSGSINVVCSNPYEKIEEIINLIDKETDINKSIHMRQITEEGNLKNCIEIYNIEGKFKITFNNVENISEVLKVVEVLENKGLEISNIYLNIENKDYNNINDLKKLDVKYNLKIYYSISSVDATLNEFITMRETLNYYKKMIQEANLSPLEKVMFAYDLIKSFEYQEVDDEYLSNSRSIHKIIKDGKIVCVGYAKFFSQLLKELGIDSYTVHTNVPVVNKDGNNMTEGHARNMVVINDDKYGLHGRYAFDATWDSDFRFVKCITEDGQEKIKIKDKVKPTEKIVKEYDGMDLYNYFLIPEEKYCEVFKGEKEPILKEEGYYSSNSAVPNTNISKTSTGLTEEQFIQLLTVVKKCEGYQGEYLEHVIQDILEIKEYDAQNKKTEITQKR